MTEYRIKEAKITLTNRELIYYYPQNTGHGPNNEGNDDFFLPEYRLPSPPPPPPPSSPLLNKVTYSIDSLTFDSLSQSVDFAIDFIYDNPDTAWLYSCNVFLNINPDAAPLIKVNWNHDLFDPAYYVFEIDTYLSSPTNPGFDLYASDTSYYDMVSVPTDLTELCHVHLSLTACGMPIWENDNHFLLFSLIGSKSSLGSSSNASASANKIYKPLPYIPRSILSMVRLSTPQRYANSCLEILWTFRNRCTSKPNCLTCSLYVLSTSQKSVERKNKTV